MASHSPSRQARDSAMEKLFSRERELLRRSELVQSAPEAENAVLKAQLTELCLGYRQLLRQTMKVTTVGDATQLQLLRTGEELSEALTKVAQLNDNLRSLQQEKDEIFAMTVHDLKSPLSGIHGMATIISNPDLSEPDEHRGMGGDILGLADSMLSMINDLVDLYMLESGTLRLNPSLVTIGDLRERIHKAISGHARRKHIILNFRTTDPNAALVLDADNWMRAVTNLTSNAVKYSPPGSTVTIGLLLEKSRLLFSVADQGPGISPSDQQKLFRKFARLTARPTGGESSSGLGLAIVKKVVDGLGGSVWCDSDLGRGSTFYVQTNAFSSGD